MALIFPTSGAGSASFTTFTVASSADFRIEIDQIKMPPVAVGTGVFLGNSGSTGFLLATTSSNKWYFKLSTSKNLIPAETFAPNALINNIVISRVSNTITMSSDGITTIVDSTNTFDGFSFNIFGQANGGSQFTGAIAGGIRLYNAAGTLVKSFNFDQAVSATVIPESVSSDDATLSGFAQSGSGFDGNSLNVGPTANAGSDQADVTPGSTVTLDGTGSTDSDGTIVSYLWEETTASGVTINNATSATATFTAPSQQTLTFRLTVTDNNTATDTDTVDIGIGAAAPTISITSPTAISRVKQRNIQTNSFDFTFTGDITALPSGAIVQYSYDESTWATLDNAPTTAYSGVVTVTSTQEVFIRLLDGVTAYSAGSIVCAAVAVVGGAGQSNQGARITNNQTVSLEAGAKTPLLMIEPSYVVSDLADPTGRPGQNPANQGSLGPGIISKLANANKDITYCWINYSQGGTGILAHVNPSEQWTRQAAFISRLGGLEINFLLIGETDMGTGQENQAFYELRYGEYVDDVFNAYGIGTYIIGVPKANYSTDAEYRAGIASVISTNENAYDGGDLRPLDLANTGGDGTHITTNAQATQAVDIIFAAYEANNNARPTAIAGPDQTDIAAGATVQLSGSGTDTDGTITGYAWTQTQGATVTLSNAAIANPTFTAPTANEPQTLTLSLIVTDNEGASSTADTLNIGVLAQNQTTTKNVTFDLPVEIVGQANMLYTLQLLSGGPSIVNGTLDTSASTVTINIDSVGSVSNGTPIYLEARNLTTSNGSTAIGYAGTENAVVVTS